MGELEVLVAVLQLLLDRLRELLTYEEGTAYVDDEADEHQQGQEDQGEEQEGQEQPIHQTNAQTDGHTDECRQSLKLASLDRDGLGTVAVHVAFQDDASLSGCPQSCGCECFHFGSFD